MRFVPPGGSGRSGKQMNDEPERYQGASDGRTYQHSVPPKMLSTVGRSPTAPLLQYNNSIALCKIASP